MQRESIIISLASVTMLIVILMAFALPTFADNQQSRVIYGYCEDGTLSGSTISFGEYNSVKVKGLTDQGTLIYGGYTFTYHKDVHGTPMWTVDKDSQPICEVNGQILAIGCIDKIAYINGTTLPLDANTYQITSISAGCITDTFSYCNLSIYEPTQLNTFMLGAMIMIGFCAVGVILYGAYAMLERE